MFVLINRLMKQKTDALSIKYLTKEQTKFISIGIYGSMTNALQTLALHDNCPPRQLPSTTIALHDKCPPDSSPPRHLPSTTNALQTLALQTAALRHICPPRQLPSKTNALQEITSLNKIT